MAKAAAGILMALMLAGCAGGQFGGETPEVQTPDGMAGRWMLTAPNAPSCGMNFAGALGVQEGTLVPEGGCPEKFFLSRSWALDQNTLVIKDDSGQPLAKLNFASGRFDGQSTAGTPVTLNR